MDILKFDFLLILNDRLWDFSKGLVFSSTKNDENLNINLNELSINTGVLKRSPRRFSPDRRLILSRKLSFVLNWALEYPVVCRLRLIHVLILRESGLLTQNLLATPNFCWQKWPKIFFPLLCTELLALRWSKKHPVWVLTCVRFLWLVS